MKLFIDTETTGLEKSDRICSIGIVYDNQVSQELIHPQKKIPPSASAIHHITNEMIKESPSFSQSKSFLLLQEFNTAETILISHNAPFDLEMLQKEGITWQGRVIDTLKCSKALMDDLEGYSLQFLRYECRLYREEKSFFEAYQTQIFPHESISDALHTKMLYEYLLDLADQEGLIKLSQSRLLINRLTFGKYAKKTIESVVQKDPAYLRWMLDSMMDMDEDLRYSIEYYLTPL